MLDGLKRGPGATLLRDQAHAFGICKDGDEDMTEQAPITPAEAAATPLTAAELEDLRRLAEARTARVARLTDEVWAFRLLARPPIVAESAYYFTFGRRFEAIPENLFTDPAVMLAHQQRLAYDHLRNVDDDYVPYLLPWFGTGVLASAFGSKVTFSRAQDPAVDPSWYPVTSVEDIDNLRIPDPERDGLMPDVLRYLRHWREHATLPIGITDMQGPLVTANQLMGYDQLIYLMYDEPAAAHRLMDKITDGFIAWVRAQKAVIGEADTFCISDQQFYVGPHAGVWFSDDDSTLVNAEIYREFVVPYNSRIFKAFGGGFLHYCGNGSHQTDNFLATEGLSGLNVSPMHNLQSLAELQAKTMGKLVLYVPDFTPVDYGAYADEFARLIDPRGVVVLSHYSPILGMLASGRYDAIDRSDNGATDVHRRFVEAFARV